jgi:DNA helicase II / ATP-dependent DNA helicase PcrA
LTSINKIFGPPGSGKTTYLLNLVEQELTNGTPANQIGYFAFTRKAATEAKDRAMLKFPTLNAQTDFPWFRTLHSLAFRALNISTGDMMLAGNYAEFSKETGIEVNVEHGEEDFMVKADNPILSEINIARIRGEDLRTYYNRSNMDIEWYHFEYVERAYRHYKQSRNLLDFTDLLEQIVDQPDKLPKLDVLIIDEAQDLSRLQWKLVEHLVRTSKRVYIAGDDDQAVFTWAGADVDAFLNFEGSITVLQQSWRVPARVHALADEIVHRIKNRQEKVWRPREFDGAVHTYRRFEDVDVTHGDWLVMAPANYMLNEVHGWLKSQGILFERHGQRSIPQGVLDAIIGWEELRKGHTITTDMALGVYRYLDGTAVARGHKKLTGAMPDEWHSMESLVQKHGLNPGWTNTIWHEALTKIGDDKREYAISLLRRGQKLRGHIPVRLSTIHGAKGGEADNVLLLTDLSSKFAGEYHNNPDAIHRLFYVGITRAKQNLHIVMPKNEQRGFRL